ncbi:hypothetical protein [Prosthecobacter sp.]|uniref:hypothetical protein n=1 Tax=Prosthecobacter sp. TaxID=1965333 RepID=UPI00378328EE
MDARELNRQQDEQLLKTGVVDRELFFDLHNAHGYDAASSVGWARGKLEVLAARLRSGAGLRVYEPTLQGEVEIGAASAVEFFAWVLRHFPHTLPLQTEGAA